MNDTNTNKADDMNEDDVTLTGSEGENTAVESDAAADATLLRGSCSRATRRHGRHGNRIPGCRRSERFDDGTGQRAVLHRLRRRR